MSSVSARFWSKVDMSGGPDACWPWTAGKYRDEYGQFAIARTGRRAQAVALELHSGELAGGRCALHTCDNPPCCNPKHLFWGTQQENTADRHQKGRSAEGASIGNAALTEDDVVAIRQRYIPKDRENGVRPLAEEFGISRVTVADILRGATWRRCLDRAPCQPKKPYVGKQKLSDDQVYAIRARFPAETQTALAKEFGVNQTTISVIVRHKTRRSI